MNIKTFGTVDQPSLDQLERCLTASEEDASGVLCADHHKGYSMPIGGVIASASVLMPAGVRGTTVLQAVTRGACSTRGNDQNFAYVASDRCGDGGC